MFAIETQNLGVGGMGWSKELIPQNSSSRARADKVKYLVGLAREWGQGGKNM